MTDPIARALAHATARTAARGNGSVPPSWVPSGPTVHTGSGLSVVHLRQTYGGIPVRGAVRSVRFDRDRRIEAFTGRTVRVAGGVPLRPTVDVRAAAYVAARHLADGVLREEAPDLAARVSTRRPRVRFRSPGPEAVTGLSKIPFREPISASLAVLEDGSALVWEVRLGLPGPHATWTVLVTAGEPGPRVLRAERTSAHAFSALVFRHEPGTTDANGTSHDRTEVPFPLPRGHYPDFDGAALRRADWCDRPKLSGNNAWCEDARGRTVTASPIPGGHRFEASDPQGREQAMVNAFYEVNRLHDFFYLLGFDETMGNFQEEIDAATGKDRDPVAVTVWDAEFEGLAFFTTHPDGVVSELHLGRLGTRHSAFDPGVVIHEYVHGVTSRVVGGPDVSEPFRHPQSRALAEGFSDYFALTLRNRDRRTDGVPETRVYGGWVSGDGATGLRRHPYDDTFPGTYGTLGSPGFERAHDAGQVWCAALLALNHALELGEGTDAGDERGWRLVFDALRLLHPGPSGPTFLHARDAILSEFRGSVEGGRLPADPLLADAIWACFARYGMGPAATSPSAGYHGIVEDLSGPGDDR